MDEDTPNLWTQETIDIVKANPKTIALLRKRLFWGIGLEQKKRLDDLTTGDLENILITERQVPVIYSIAILAILKERYQHED